MKLPQIQRTHYSHTLLEEVLKASFRLTERGVPHSVAYMLEPGRFRMSRDPGEKAHMASAELRSELYPDSVPARIFVTHTRPEPLLGTVQPLNSGRDNTVALGFIGEGGTMTVLGMLFINRCTWVHILVEAAQLLGLLPEELLTAQELAALNGKGSPEEVIT